MKLDEIKAAADPLEASPNHLVLFLPYLRLKHGHIIGGVEFLPLRDAGGKVPEQLVSGVAAIEKILSGYLDKQGARFKNCVVATGSFTRAGRRIAWGRGRCSSTWSWRAYVFPLVVKLLLASDKLYALTDEDRIRCLTVDRILASRQWYEDPDAEKESEQSATEIVSKTRFDLMWEKARKAAQEKLSGGSDMR